jgi:hypothetical protein
VNTEVLEDMEDDEEAQDVKETEDMADVKETEDRDDTARMFLLHWSCRLEVDTVMGPHLNKKNLDSFHDQVA